MSRDDLHQLELTAAADSTSTARAYKPDLSLADAIDAYGIRFVHNAAFETVNSIRDIIESLSEESSPSRPPAPRSRHILGLDIPDGPLLTIDEERSLFLRMNCLRFLAAQRQLTAKQRPPRAVDLRTIQNLIDAANIIRNNIACACQRLVISIAAGYVSPGTSLPDLAGDGNLVLLRAIDHFDVSKGFRFSTYATHSIRRQLGRSMRRRQRTNAASGEDFPEPVIEESAGEWIDVHPAELVRKILSEVAPRERRMLEFRFALRGGLGMTYEQIGFALGLSTETVRKQILACCRRARLRHSERLGL